MVAKIGAVAAAAPAAAPAAAAAAAPAAAPAAPGTFWQFSSKMYLHSNTVYSNTVWPFPTAGRPNFFTWSADTVRQSLKISQAKILRGWISKILSSFW